MGGPNVVWDPMSKTGFPRMLDVAELTPPRVEMTKPSSARLYDVMLGGKDNFSADRALAEALWDLAPGIPQVFRRGRDFLIRSVRHMAARGIRQFLDLGCGLPSPHGNIHQVAQQRATGARVVYVDNDAIVAAHGNAILVENEYTAAIATDLRDASAVFSTEAVRHLIDPSEPIGLLLAGTVAHLDDADDPRGVVRAYLDRVPPGSMMALSHFHAPKGDLARLARDMERMLIGNVGSGRFRTRAEITALFDGAELDEYGLTEPQGWRPDHPAQAHAFDGLLLCGVARKP